MERRTFRSMGTDVEVLLDGVHEVDASAAFSWAHWEFERLEAIFTRFRDDSELGRLNADGEIDASPEMLTVVSAALAARERTGGRFDPTVHDALVAAGYDRTFELVADRTVRAAPSPGPAGGAVRIDGERIELAPRVRLDLGGIVKGYAADCVAAELATIGACLVNAGGDVAVRGVPSLGAWGVAVETPDGSMTLALVAGGLATSGVDRRRWRTEEGEQHHLIDPRTGRSADSDVVRVTVAARSALEAEVLAKAFFLAGERAGAAEADALGVPAVFVTRDRRVRMTGGLS